ncbi:putative conserved membrane protein [Nostocoides japonicum T1-X7]|uniref:Putative conserved membrane protein n=1 Tax=Nostocoides japonicum T1-X7 TaxID=1194083 RepID=A0A077M8A3_9MICO|nr:PH domain-containing protein [Tetrasphaera japonica]CCH80260.1 putative conserved membrane protein [Tetrasphaera japonica T1-X7]
MTQSPSDPHLAFAVFRPRRGRIVAITFAVLVLAAFTLVAIVAPGAEWKPFDRALVIAFGLAIAWFLLRFAMIRAVPTRESLVVRNLLTSRTLEWSEIVSVEFAGADPWVSLDLADTDELAVMAIQRADGPRARKEAARLAALVTALGEAGDR